MKRIFASIVAITCAGFVVSTTLASEPVVNTSAPAGSSISCAFLQDTGRMPKKDTSRMNKKKHKDSTSRPHRDSATTRH